MAYVENHVKSGTQGLLKCGHNIDFRVCSQWLSFVLRLVCIRLVSDALFVVVEVLNAGSLTVLLYSFTESFPSDKTLMCFRILRFILRMIKESDLERENEADTVAVCFRVWLLRWWWSAQGVAMMVVVVVVWLGCGHGGGGSAEGVAMGEVRWWGRGHGEVRW